MKEKLVVLITIILLTSPIYTLFHSNFLENVVVGLTLFLGVLGLYSIYESYRYKDKRKRWLILFFGVMSILIAYFTLEALYASMYGRR